jgi:hypothetical protein
MVTPLINSSYLVIKWQVAQMINVSEDGMLLTCGTPCLYSRRAACDWLLML